MTDEKIERINALAKKAKTEELTDAEKKEQQELRAEYVADFRKSLKAQLDNTVVRPKPAFFHGFRLGNAGFPQDRSAEMEGPAAAV